MQRQHGFTLLEVLITMGIIGTLAAMILPNIGLTPGSQMTMALRDFTTTLRATYDSAVLSGRAHRLVIEIKSGTYWAEAAPLGYTGRPPLAQEESASETFNNDARVRLVEDLDKIANDARKAESAPGSTEVRTYTPRSVLVAQRRALQPVKWSEVDDNILFKRQLPETVAFAAVMTETMRNKLEFAQAGPKDIAYVYFFPWGQGTQTDIHIGQKSENGINDAGPKFSVILDPLSGHSELLEGFQDADFVKDIR